MDRPSREQVTAAMHEIEALAKHYEQLVREGGRGGPNERRWLALRTILDVAERFVNDARIKAAIRRQTVDVDDGDTPNGPFEQAIVDIQNAVDQKRFFSSPAAARTKICAAMATMCSAQAVDTKELREAADEFFGEDFTKS